jgi:hypothetical protein
MANLNQLVNTFYKLAQNLTILAPQLLSAQDKSLFIQHTQQLIKESTNLVEAVKRSIELNMVNQASLSYIQNFRTGALRLNQLSIQTETPNQDELNNVYKDIMSNFNTLSNTYINKDSDMMKKLKESLTFLGSRTAALPGASTVPVT